MSRTDPSSARRCGGPVMTTQILICSPVHYNFEPQTVLSLVRALDAFYPRARFYTIAGCPLIDVARAQLVHHFLNSEWGTHLLMLDSDVAFQPTALARALAADKDVIGVPYPLKGITHRDEMRAAAARGDANWEQAGLSFTVSPRMD